MNKGNLITLIVTIAVVVVLLALMYYLAKRNEKKRDEQQKSIDQASQKCNMLIIDKKKLRITKSGLPQQVIDQVPWYYKRSRVPVVKAKVGPQIATFIADGDIFDQIPVKKEVKATVSGIYITEVRGMRGPLPKVEKKKNFFQKLMGEK